MKVRTDFVTNSSSSSFILARKSELNDKQKAAIIKHVEESMLGEQVLSPASTEEDIQKFFNRFDSRYLDDSKQKDMREALAKGMSIYIGDVIFEEAEWQIDYFYREMWDVVKENSNGEFKAIDDLLYY